MSQRTHRSDQHHLKRSRQQHPVVIHPALAHCTPPWNAPEHSSLETFAWPSLWFDVPSISPPAFVMQPAQQFDMFDTLPDLIHCDLRTPEASPVSMRDACTTPAQDSQNVVAVCDVPLVAPRPLPFTPPAFLQFDCLPEEDEDLSFPPYTHSRRHSCDKNARLEKQNPNPLKRPAPPPPTNTPEAGIYAATRAARAAAEVDGITPLPSISKKRRRIVHSENAVPAFPAIVPPQHPMFIDGAEPFIASQLVHLTRDDLMSWT